MNKNDKTVKYRIGDQGEFIIHSYNKARPFSSFFPGIAGVDGKPMWAFFANRAQCVCSMGTGGKDGAMVEFQPANKAFILLRTHGFRTFIKVRQEDKIFYYEPFQDGGAYHTDNFMSMGNPDLYIEERNHNLKMSVGVRYYCIPGEPFNALSRQVIIRNEGDKDMSVQLLDGLPYILPYGITESQVKEMSNTLQAWIRVVNLETGIPFYKLKTIIDDKPLVTRTEKGNFYLGCYYDNGRKLVRPVIDPRLIFGPEMNLCSPAGFTGEEEFILPEKQVASGIMPSAMGLINFTLPGGGKKNIYSLVGHSDLNKMEKINERLLDENYFAEKLEEARGIMTEIGNNMLSESGNYQFNLYCRNTFVDNILRGGLPMTLGKDKKPVTLHLFSRRHGDIERDYNTFYIHPEYYSQGDGNYRDVCQNRRNDLWFNPDIEKDNIKTFANLIQLDGYNPLQLKSEYFVVPRIPNALKPVSAIIKHPFRLGTLLEYIEDNNINLKMSRKDIVQMVVSLGKKEIEAEYREGYWIDHWTYITDLIENFRNVYPDRYWDIFTGREYSFYDSPAIVRPLKNRMVKRIGGIRQDGSVVIDKDKSDLIAARDKEPHKVRTRQGKGDIYKTSLLVKLFCLIANKYAGLDPSGTGIEMEADKPGWYDALNGLPGLFGSSTCETFELKRLVRLAAEALDNIKIAQVAFPRELAVFLEGLFKGKNYKDKYRRETRMGISGRERIIKIKHLKEGLSKISTKLTYAMEKAYDPDSGLYHTYFINEVVSLENKKTRQHPLPLFLEGQVHALRLMPGKEKARAIYNAVRERGLYDKALKMYKVNASLENEPMEIGRVKVFTPGWLENESIWIHMEYKYLLELLRNGLYEEFYDDFKKSLIPFQDPAVLGRSILENCSFIVSSAHPEKSLHGTGFLPRLSGATAEFINMWLWMCIGKEPFFVNSKNELNLKLQPVIAGWLFTEEGTFGFNMLGSVKIVYHNPQKKDTFGHGGVQPFKILWGKVSIEGDTVPAPYAGQIRDRQIKRIDVYLG